MHVCTRARARTHTRTHTHTHTQKEHIIGLVQYAKVEGSAIKIYNLSCYARDLILFICATFIAFSVTPDT